jgi:ribonucleotide reductase alpha subunit
MFLLLLHSNSYTMDENIFDKLREMSGKFPEKFNILEEQIDVKVQMEYFKFSKKHKKNIDKKSQIDLDNIPNINNEELDIEEKKKTLVELAYIDDPKAFRFIEEYIKTAPKELKDCV